MQVQAYLLTAIDIASNACNAGDYYDELTHKLMAGCDVLGLCAVPSARLMMALGGRHRPPPAETPPAARMLPARALPCACCT